MIEVLIPENLRDFVDENLKKIKSYQLPTVFQKKAMMKFRRDSKSSNRCNRLNFSIMSQKIRIKLKSYDHNLVDKSAEKIVKTVKSTGAVVTGPIPLPTHKKIFTVLRSPHVNKKSREQFQLSSYKRLLDIYSSSSKTIDALMKLELPSGVEVEIKV